MERLSYTFPGFVCGRADRAACLIDKVQPRAGSRPLLVKAVIYAEFSAGSARSEAVGAFLDDVAAGMAPDPCKTL